MYRAVVGGRGGRWIDSRTKLERSYRNWMIVRKTDTDEEYRRKTYSTDVIVILISANAASANVSVALESQLTSHPSVRELDGDGIERSVRREGGGKRL